MLLKRFLTFISLIFKWLHILAFTILFWAGPAFCVQNQINDEWFDELEKTISESLLSTASWMDSAFQDDETIDESAKAWGKITIGWQPRTGNWGYFPVKFRIKVRLPSLQNRIDLIISDTEEEDFQRLPLDKTHPIDEKESSEDYHLAIRFIHSSSQEHYLSTRIGLGDGTVYSRMSYRWRKPLIDDFWSIQISPAVEYYIGQGFGHRVVFDSAWGVGRRAEIRWSYGLIDRQSFDNGEWRQGLYYLRPIGDDAAIVQGFQASGDYEPDYRENNYNIFFRWRQVSIRKWLYYEIEPFVDFPRERDFRREYGIAFRLQGLFGARH